MKKILKMLGWGLLGLILLTFIGTVVFVYASPEFGQKPTGEYLKAVEQSDNYRDGGFTNQIETSIDRSLENTIGIMKESMNATNTSPSSPIPTGFGEEEKSAIDTLLRVTWYGHSAILLEKRGISIFLDPMLGDVASPVPLFGQRFGNAPKFDMETIEWIDYVVFSHDHYDHLDYPTIKSIKDKVGHFFTPLGLGSHLRSWGVPAENITELDWWEETSEAGISLTATPARHFSGRGFGDASSTLWASWAIDFGGSKIYFSGDGGYGPHFKEIGEKLGPFDFAMMECGQYNIRWEAIHMMPEQTVQATVDLKANSMMPIHWGGFALSPHEWTDPIERVSKAVLPTNITLLTPKIGKSFYPAMEQPKSVWWVSVD